MPTSRRLTSRWIRWRQKIKMLLQDDDDFKHLEGLLKSVPGVRPKLSATLAADLAELGDATANGSVPWSASLPSPGG